MSECIDCLHYEACKDIHDILDTSCRGEFDYEGLERGCKNFTDPSEWVHIPCTDKKTTDEEIIMRLEWCVSRGNRNYNTDIVLDLIRRQKAEIDSAKAKIEICAEVIKRQDAEIKRLKECPKKVGVQNG